MRRELERGEVALERLRRIFDATFVEGRDLAKSSSFVHGSCFVTELDLDRVRERLGVVGRRVDRDERFGRLQIVRLELEDLLVGLGRAIELLLLVRPELRRS